MNILMAAANKGGVSKSTVSHMAILAARDLGENVHIVDTDMNNSDLANHFGDEVESFDLMGHMTGQKVAFQSLVSLNSPTIKNLDKVPDLVLIDTPAGAGTPLIENIDHILKSAEKAGNKLFFLVPVNASLATQGFASDLVEALDGRAKIIISLNCFNTVGDADFKKGVWSQRPIINDARKAGHLVEFEFGDLYGRYAQNLYATQRPISDLKNLDFSYLKDMVESESAAEIFISQLNQIFKDGFFVHHFDTWYDENIEYLQEAMKAVGVV